MKASKKKYPDFSPISRFGIGLLTCFLIADDIDIITKDAATEKAILLKIKKVHGKYLLKYLNYDNIPQEINKHGTLIKLIVRSEVNLTNIEKDIKKWIVIPGCHFTLKINEKIIPIGFESPAEVLKYYLKEIGYEVDGHKIQVKEVVKNGVHLAYALRYTEHWKEWNFIEIRELDNKTIYPIGTCVEGIRIDFSTPGFNGLKYLAIVNSTGKNAPKTNVARSNLESTPDKQAMLLYIYQLYLEQIENELHNLRQSGFSISWASNEANWLLKGLINNQSSNRGREVEIVDLPVFENALKLVKIILFESHETRELVSYSDVIKMKSFWTIDCASYSSANSLIKEVKSSNTSALTLLNTIYGSEDSHTKHIDNLLCKLQTGTIIDEIISKEFQVKSIVLIPDQRRLDLQWTISEEKTWDVIEIQEDEYQRRHPSKCYIQLLDIETNIQGLDDQVAINSQEALFLLKKSEISKFILSTLVKMGNRSEEDNIALSKIVSIIKLFFMYGIGDVTKIEEIIESRLDRSNNNRNIDKLIWSRIDKKEFIDAILKTKFIKYDTTIWTRRDMFL